MTQKSITLNPEVTAYVKAKAEQENRSFSSMVEMLIIRTMSKDPDWDYINYTLKEKADF